MALGYKATVALDADTSRLTAAANAALARIQAKAKINFLSGEGGARFTQPLGRIAAQADEFTKSMGAANARVIAFGASVGVLNAVVQGFKNVITSTIAVEKSLTKIGAILSNLTKTQLKEMGGDIFKIAKETGQSFDEVSKAALEFARQGLPMEDTLKRTKAAMVLARLEGYDTEKAVMGLTAAFNGFSASGYSMEQMLHKMDAVSNKFAVSTKDLIEAISRSGAVAQQAGVSFDELNSIVTVVQERTARGGAVIGNAFKTVFTRLRESKIRGELENLGVDVRDVNGELLSTTQTLLNLASKLGELSSTQQADIINVVSGKQRINEVTSLLVELGKAKNQFQVAMGTSLGATDEAFRKNELYNKTIDALINKTKLAGQQLAISFGETGFMEDVVKVVEFLANSIENLLELLNKDNKSLGAKALRGLFEGISNAITGPGLVAAVGVLIKLGYSLAAFLSKSLQDLLGINKQAKDRELIEKSVLHLLEKQPTIMAELVALDKDRVSQVQVLRKQYELLIQEQQKASSIAVSLAPALMKSKAVKTYVKTKTQEAQGFAQGFIPTASQGVLPSMAREQQAIRQGVGGARIHDTPVVIPNFNFNRGQKGTVVAHTGEYIVPNFGGSGGDAIFNREMIKRMGLPSGAVKITSSLGYVPNFARGTQTSQTIPGALSTAFTPLIKTDSPYGKSLGGLLPIWAQRTEGRTARLALLRDAAYWLTSDPSQREDKWARNNPIVEFLSKPENAESPLGKDIIRALQTSGVKAVAKTEAAVPEGEALVKRGYTKNTTPFQAKVIEKQLLKQREEHNAAAVTKLGQAGDVSMFGIKDRLLNKPSFRLAIDANKLGGIAMITLGEKFAGVQNMFLETTMSQMRSIPYFSGDSTSGKKWRNEFPYLHSVQINNIQRRSLLGAPRLNENLKKRIGGSSDLTNFITKAFAKPVAGLAASMFARTDLVGSPQIATQIASKVLKSNAAEKILKSQGALFAPQVTGHVFEAALKLGTAALSGDFGPFTQNPTLAWDFPSAASMKHIAEVVGMAPVPNRGDAKLSGTKGDARSFINKIFYDKELKTRMLGYMVTANQLFAVSSNRAKARAEGFAPTEFPEDFYPKSQKALYESDQEGYFRLYRKVPEGGFKTKRPAMNAAAGHLPNFGIGKVQQPRTGNALSDFVTKNLGRFNERVGYGTIGTFLKSTDSSFNNDLRSLSGGVDIGIKQTRRDTDLLLLLQEALYTNRLNRNMSGEGIRSATSFDTVKDVVRRYDKTGKGALAKEFVDGMDLYSLSHSIRQGMISSGIPSDSPPINFIRSAFDSDVLKSEADFALRKSLGRHRYGNTRYGQIILEDLHGENLMVENRHIPQIIKDVVAVTRSRPGMEPEMPPNEFIRKFVIPKSVAVDAGQAYISPKTYGAIEKGFKRIGLAKGYIPNFGLTFPQMLKIRRRFKDLRVTRMGGIEDSKFIAGEGINVSRHDPKPFNTFLHEAGHAVDYGKDAGRATSFMMAKLEKKKRSPKEDMALTQWDITSEKRANMFSLGLLGKVGADRGAVNSFIESIQKPFRSHLELGNRALHRAGHRGVEYVQKPFGRDFGHNYLKKIKPEQIEKSGILERFKEALGIKRFAKGYVPNFAVPKGLPYFETGAGPRVKKPWGPFPKVFDPMTLYRGEMGPLPKSDVFTTTDPTIAKSYAYGAGQFLGLGGSLENKDLRQKLRGLKKEIIKTMPPVVIKSLGLQSALRGMVPLEENVYNIGTGYNLDAIKNYKMSKDQKELLVSIFGKSGERAVSRFEKDQYARLIMANKEPLFPVTHGFSQHSLEKAFIQQGATRKQATKKATDFIAKAKGVVESEKHVKKLQLSAGAKIKFLQKNGLGPKDLSQAWREGYDAVYHSDAVGGPFLNMNQRIMEETMKQLKVSSLPQARQPEIIVRDPKMLTEIGREYPWASKGYIPNFSAFGQARSLLKMGIGASPTVGELAKTALKTVFGKSPFDISNIKAQLREGLPSMTASAKSLSDLDSIAGVLRMLKGLPGGKQALTSFLSSLDPWDYDVKKHSDITIPERGFEFFTKNRRSYLTFPREHNLRESSLLAMAGDMRATDWLEQSGYLSRRAGNRVYQLSNQEWLESLTKEASESINLGATTGGKPVRRYPHVMEGEVQHVVPTWGPYSRFDAIYKKKASTFGPESRLKGTKFQKVFMRDRWDFDLNKNEKAELEYLLNQTTSSNLERYQYGLVARYVASKTFEQPVEYRNTVNVPIVGDKLRQIDEIKELAATDPSMAKAIFGSHIKTPSPAPWPFAKGFVPNFAWPKPWRLNKEQVSVLEAIRDTIGPFKSVFTQRLGSGAFGAVFAPNLEEQQALNKHFGRSDIVEKLFYGARNPLGISSGSFNQKFVTEMGYPIAEFLLALQAQRIKLKTALPIEGFNSFLQRNFKLYNEAKINAQLFVPSMFKQRIFGNTLYSAARSALPYPNPLLNVLNNSQNLFIARKAKLRKRFLQRTPQAREVDFDDLHDQNLMITEEGIEFLRKTLGPVSSHMAEISNLAKRNIQREVGLVDTGLGRIKGASAHSHASNYLSRIERRFPEEATQGYIPNFAIKFQRVSPRQRKWTTESGSALWWHKPDISFDGVKERALHVDSIESYKKGDGFKLMSRLFKLAERAKHHVYSSGLSRQTFDIDLKKDPWSNFLSIYPQLRWRDSNKLKTSGEILFQKQRDGFVPSQSFDDLDELKGIISKINSAALPSIDLHHLRTFPIEKASGYIPNFSSILQSLNESMDREATFVPKHMIRIGQDTRLKSPSNPLALGVTNTRDEALGMKSVPMSRIAKAKMSVPNFAKQPPTPFGFSAQRVQAWGGGPLSKVAAADPTAPSISSAMKKANETMYRFARAIETGTMEAVQAIDSFATQITNSGLKNSLKITDKHLQGLGGAFQDLQNKAEKSILKKRSTFSSQDIGGMMDINTKQRSLGQMITRKIAAEDISLSGAKMQQAFSASSVPAIANVSKKVNWDKLALTINALTQESLATKESLESVKKAAFRQAKQMGMTTEQAREMRDIAGRQYAMKQGGPTVPGDYSVASPTRDPVKFKNRLERLSQHAMGITFALPMVTGMISQFSPNAEKKGYELTTGQRQARAGIEMAGTSISSGMMLGSIFGPWGSLVGTALGGIVALGAAAKAASLSLKDLKEQSEASQTNISDKQAALQEAVSLAEKIKDPNTPELLRNQYLGEYQTRITKAGLADSPLKDKLLADNVQPNEIFKEFALSNLVKNVIVPLADISRELAAEKNPEKRKELETKLRENLSGVGAVGAQLSDADKESLKRVAEALAPVAEFKRTTTNIKLGENVSSGTWTPSVTVRNEAIEKPNIQVKPEDVLPIFTFSNLAKDVKERNAKIWADEINAARGSVVTKETISDGQTVATVKNEFVSQITALIKTILEGTASLAAEQKLIAPRLDFSKNLKDFLAVGVSKFKAEIEKDNASIAAVAKNFNMILSDSVSNALEPLRKVQLSRDFELKMLGLEEQQGVRRIGLEKIQSLGELFGENVPKSFDQDRVMQAFKSGSFEAVKASMIGIQGDLFGSDNEKLRRFNLILQQTGEEMTALSDKTHELVVASTIQTKLQELNINIQQKARESMLKVNEVFIKSAKNISQIDFNQALADSEYNIRIQNPREYYGLGARETEIKRIGLEAERKRAGAKFDYQKQVAGAFLEYNKATLTQENITALNLNTKALDALILSIQGLVKNSSNPEIEKLKTRRDAAIKERDELGTPFDPRGAGTEKYLQIDKLQDEIKSLDAMITKMEKADEAYKKKLDKAIAEYQENDAFKDLDKLPIFEQARAKAVDLIKQKIVAGEQIDYREIYNKSYGDAFKDDKEVKITPEMQVALMQSLQTLIASQDDAADAYRRVVVLMDLEAKAAKDRIYEEGSLAFAIDQYRKRIDREDPSKFREIFSSYSEMGDRFRKTGYERASELAIEAARKNKLSDKDVNIAGIRARYDAMTFDTGVERAYDSFKDEAGEFKNIMGYTIPMAFRDGMAQAFSDLSTGAATSFEGALLNMVGNIARQLNEMFSKQLATNIMRMFENSNIFSDLFGFLTGTGKTEKKGVGGHVAGGSGVKDDIPAMLSRGEYVIRRGSVQKYGKNFLDALNAGIVPGFGSGGSSSGSGSTVGSMVGTIITGLISRGIANKQLSDQYKQGWWAYGKEIEGYKAQKGRDFFIPGSQQPDKKIYGHIVGPYNLKKFINQESTSGALDRISSFNNGFSFSLEDQSRRLSGRAQTGALEGDVIAGEVKSAKSDAWNLLTGSVKEYIARKEAEKAEKKKNLTSLGMMAIMGITSGLIDKFVTAREEGKESPKFDKEVGQTYRNLSDRPYVDKNGNVVLPKASTFTSRPRYTQAGEVTRSEITDFTIPATIDTGPFAEVVATQDAYLNWLEGPVASRVVREAANRGIRPDLANSWLFDFFIKNVYPGNVGVLPPLPELPELPEIKAVGGLIKGRSMQDNVPALLMGGEYVINKSSVDKYGTKTLDAINRGVFKKYATGGMVAGGTAQPVGDSVISKLDDVANKMSNAPVGGGVTVNITMNNSGAEVSTQTTGDQETLKALGNRIKNVVKQVLIEEQRIGGRLR
jgi:TP901 family phage tail tape measure protein